MVSAPKDFSEHGRPKKVECLTENVPNREQHPRKDVKELYRIRSPESTEVDEQL